MMHTTIVRAYLVEGSVPLSRTHVELHRKQAEPAELIGSASTDARGEATFRYPAVTPFTVVAVVRNQSGTAVRTIRVKPSANRLFLRIDVPIELALARRLGLVGIKKGRSAERKKADLAAFLRKRTGPGSDPGPDIELCLARMALDMLAGVGDRATPLQKRLALYAEQQLGSGPVDLARVAQFAERGAAVLDEVGPPGLRRCSGDSGIAHLAERMAAPGGPLNALIQALSTAAPNPSENLGSPTPGTPFTVDLEFNKECNTQFEDGTLGEPAKTQMTELLQSDARQLLPPSINLVEVWDPNLRNNVRIGDVTAKQLTVQALAAVDGGWASTVVDLDVPLDDEHCLVVLVDDDGRLVFEEARQPIPGLDGVVVDVHGGGLDPLPTEEAASFLGDTVVFTWPESATREGLYTITLTVENTTQHVTALTQTEPPDCAVTVDRSPLTSAPLHIIVLPRLERRRARVVTTRVDCVDETDPEEAAFIPLADDVEYTAIGLPTRVSIGDAGDIVVDPQPEIRSADQYQFWNDPETWEPNLQAWPAGDGSDRLGLDELLEVRLIAHEVDGEIDRAIVRTVLIVALILLIVAVILIVAAIAAEVPPVAAVLPEVIGFLVGAAFAAGVVAIDAIVASISGVNTIGDARAGFSGRELASRLSVYRYHRVLFLAERTPLGENSTSTERLSSEVGDTAITEVFRSRALGGEYRFELVCEVD